MMNLYPAIDIKNGQVVRLTQGDFNQVTHYGNDPLIMAKKWADAGSDWLHLVDLDAALAGQPVNLEKISQIATELKIKIQVGGGIRNIATIEQYLKAGITRCIIGTQAIKDPVFFTQALKQFPNQIALGLDTRAGEISIAGWTQSSGVKLTDYLSQTDLTGLAVIIHTEIERDGMLSGLPMDRIKQSLDLMPVPMIVSGGVSSIEDIKNLAALNHPKLDGAILGKALYEGKIDLKTALAL